MRTANTLLYEFCAVHMDLNVFFFYAEVEHDKTSKITCAQRELRSACASAPSDQFSLFAGSWLSIECTTETGQTW